jgi:hypothetical protein
MSMREADARWMTLEALAERAGRELVAGRAFSRKLLCRWITEGLDGRTLEARKVGGRYLSTMDALAEFLGIEEGNRHEAIGTRGSGPGISDPGLSERLARAGLGSVAARRGEKR